jgi:hypothetical protein
MGVRMRIDIAKNAVKNYYREIDIDLFLDDIFIVWSCKTLQNYKTILATNYKDKLLFEFTWNGNENEGYLDIYDKIENIKIQHYD